MDKNLIPGPKISTSFETSAAFNIETAKINRAYLIKFLIVIALLTSQFGKDWLFHESYWIGLSIMLINPNIDTFITKFAFTQDN